MAALGVGQLPDGQVRVETGKQRVRRRTGLVGLSWTERQSDQHYLGLSGQDAGHVPVSYTPTVFLVFLGSYTFQLSAGSCAVNNSF